MFNKGRPTTLIGLSLLLLKDTTTSSTSLKKQQDDSNPSLSNSAFKKGRITKKLRLKQPIKNSP